MALRWTARKRLSAWVARLHLNKLDNYVDYSELAMGRLHPYNPAHRESTGLARHCDVSGSVQVRSVAAGQLKTNCDSKVSCISQEFKEPLE